MPNVSANQRDPIVILMAEDDPDDQKITRKAFDRAELRDRLFFVNDGQDLMDYLHRVGPYQDRDRYPDADLVLLDLNMPRKDGRTALAEIRADDGLRSLPVIAMTTSRAERDVEAAYSSGVNSFITKPAAFEELVAAVRELSAYWGGTVRLPRRVGNRFPPTS